MRRSEFTDFESRFYSELSIFNHKNGLIHRFNQKLIIMSVFELKSPFSFHLLDNLFRIFYYPGISREYLTFRIQ